MTPGAPDSPGEARPGANMTDSNKDIERGEKRGVLSTGRANDLEDADADADTDDEEE